MLRNAIEIIRKNKCIAQATILLLLLFSVLRIEAQIQVNLRVLPPYQSRVAEYASRPDLILLSISNSSTTTQQVQLTGSLTGDNGISIKVKNSYKSPSPITIAPGQTLNLNGNDIAFLFDPGSVNMKGIPLNSVIRDARLKEGNYQICIQALDYNNRQPISAEAPSGCSMFYINDLEAPVIIAPLNNQEISAVAGTQVFPITWNTPPGAAPGTEYNVKIVEIVGNKNPTDAMYSATVPAFFERKVIGTNMLTYGPADPALTIGREYALMVQAKDPSGTSSFRNRGMSQVYKFIYGSTGNTPSKNALGNIRLSGVNEPDCGCENSLDNNKNSKNIAAGNKAIIGGGFEMTINQATENNDGTFSGQGVVPMPMIGSVPGMKLRVAFEKIKVNTNNRMFEGFVKGIVSANAPGFIPKADMPEMTERPTISQITELDAYLKNQTDKMISAVGNTINSAGFELPFGLEKGPAVIGISSMIFTPTKAWFDASTSLDIPDAGPHQQLALAAKDICFDKSAFCKNGILYLAEDFTVDIMSSKFTLLSLKNNNPQSGTFIEFDKDGFKKLSIDGDYVFPANTLLDVATKQPLKVNMKATTEQGWGNWLATASMPKFMLNGVADFTFSLAPEKKIIFDHSDVGKDASMPSVINFGNGQSINITEDWHGFYIPEIIVQMPEIIKSVNGTHITVKAQHLIFDRTGFSGAVKADNILTLSDGSLDGWYFSIDNIAMSFYKNSFSNGGMNGKLMLPVSGKYEPGKERDQIDYSCNLSSPSNSEGIKYQFGATVKNNIDFKAWWAKASIGGGSNILIEGGNGSPLTAKATLNGSMEIVSEIKNLPNVALGHISFTNMQFSTSGTTFTPGNFKMGLGAANNTSFIDAPDTELLYANINNRLKGGPSYSLADELATKPADNVFQTSLMGFNFTVKEVLPYTGDGNFGITFDTRMELVNNVNFVPKATLNFSLFAKLGENRATRKWWQSVGGKINAVQLDANADLAGLKIEGMIRYFDTESQGGDKDRGFAGKLAVTLPVLETKIAMKGLFGSRTNNSRSFQFFYIDALVDFGNKGIPMFPGTQLNGFAGGAYYNMQRLPQPDPFALIKNDVKMPQEEDNKYATMESFSGVKYEPINGGVKSSLGFMAGVYFGLTSREILDAEISLAIGFANGSFNMMSLRGRGAFINEGTDFASRYKKAMGTAEIETNVQFENGRFKLFDLSAGIKFAYPVVNPILLGSGNMKFLIQNDGNWYLKAGVPWNVNPDGPIKLKLSYPWVKAEAQSYFQCGNFSIDDTPPVPAWIQSIINHGKNNGSSEENSRITNESPIEIPNKRDGDKGVITGVSLEVNSNIEFLIFYAKLRAGLGVDISLKNGVSCGNDQLGPRWYAKGQAFMGAEASLGVRVKIFGVKKNIEFLDAGLAAIVEAGLPNPIYASGTLGGYFSVLNGLIQKDFRIKFAIGDVCKTAGSNPEELNLIETIHPESGTESIFTRPAVSFNYPLNNDFIIPLEYKNDDDEYYTRYRLFRFSKEDVTISLNGSGQSFNTNHFTDIGRSRGVGANIYALSLSNNQPLLKASTNYNMQVKAKVKMYDFAAGAFLSNANEKQLLDANKNKDVAGFSYVRTDNGSIYEHSKSAEFKTDEGPKNIPVDNVVEVLPYHRQQGLPTNALSATSNNVGYVQLQMPMDASSFNSKISNKQPKVRFVMADAGNVQVSEADVQIVEGGKKWQFAMPSLMPNTAYVAKVYFKNMSPSANNTNENDTRLVARKTINLGDNSSVVISGRELTAKDALIMKNGDEELFAWYFKTGSKSNYRNKFNTLTLEKITIDGKEINKNQPSINMQAVNWSANETTKTIDLGLSGTVEYFYSSTEPFNVLDIEPQKRSVSLPQAVTTNIAAAVNRKEWMAMLNRSGIDPTDYNISNGYEVAAWQNFVDEAFGCGKKLEVKFLEMAGYTSNAQYGIQPIGPKNDVDYPTVTKVMLPDMFDVDFKNNNYNQPATATSSNSANSGSAGANSNSTLSASPAGHVISKINAGLLTSVSANVSINSLWQHITAMKVTRKSGGGGSIGHGAVNQANNVLEAMRDRGGRGVNLGYPGTVGGIIELGRSIDKVVGVYSNTPLSIAPPAGLQGGSMQIPPPKKR